VSTSEKSAVVLLSGGLDSTVSLWWAKRQGYKRLDCLTFEYGSKEEIVLKAVTKKLAELATITHHEVLLLDFLTQFAKLTKSALIQGATKELPQPSEQDLDNLERSKASAEAVWIPGRNLLFLAIAAAYAETLGGEVDIVTGFNLEEGTTFPDNTQEFIDDFTRTAARGILKAKVMILSPVAKLGKESIVQLGYELGAPLEFSNSCYTPKGLTAEGKPIHCGLCESCQRRRRGFRASKLPDPTIYTNESKEQP